jgi:hypothetical protein
MKELESKQEINMKKEGKESFSKTIEKNGIRKTIRVDQVENGYVICIEKSDDDGYSEKKYISSKNPFEKKKEEISPDESLVEDMNFGSFMDL